MILTVAASILVIAAFTLAFWQGNPCLLMHDWIKVDESESVYNSSTETSYITPELHLEFHANLQLRLVAVGYPTHLLNQLCIPVFFKKWNGTCLKCGALHFGLEKAILRRVEELEDIYKKEARRLAAEAARKALIAEKTKNFGALKKLFWKAKQTDA